MKFDNIIMNPPYNGSTHLKVLEHALTLKKDDGVLVNLSPIRWLQDPLWKYKKTCDRKKYQKSIVDKISDLEIVSGNDARSLFNIGINTDLGIYTFNDKQTHKELNLLNEIANNILSKIMNCTNEFLLDNHKIEENDDSGICIKVHPKMTMYGRKNYKPVAIANGVYINGIDVESGKHWTDERIRTSWNCKPSGSSIEYTIHFDDVDIAKNIVKSYNCKFIYRYLQLIKHGVEMPIKFLPYMQDYSKIWTDQDYCEFYGLTDEEKDFMLKDITDYIDKDFVEYNHK